MFDQLSKNPLVASLAMVFLGFAGSMLGDRVKTERDSSSIAQRVEQLQETQKNNVNKELFDQFRFATDRRLDEILTRLREMREEPRRR